jgi:hypothetical protein
MNRRALHPRSLIFWTILTGLLVWTVADVSAEWRPRDTPFGELITVAARAEGLDPSLVEAVVAVESAFSPRAVSGKGAMGLMQLMPQTARLYGVSNAFDPRQNLSGGTRHLRDLLSLFRGDLPRALAAYNAGAKAVFTYGGIPPYRETREYVRMVLARYLRIPGSSPAAVPVELPPREPAPVRQDAMEEESPAPDEPSLASVTRLVRTAARPAVTQEVRAPLVQMRGGPTISLKARGYPSVRSSQSSPDLED